MFLGALTIPSDGPKMGHFSSWGLILVDILALPRFSAGLQVDHVITAPMFFFVIGLYMIDQWKVKLYNIDHNYDKVFVILNFTFH